MNDTPTPVADRWLAGYDDNACTLDAHATMCDLERQLAEATREIDVLRRYGNKDCTAMADEELARLQREEQPNALAQGQCAGVLEMYYRQPLPNPPTEKP